MKIKFFAILLLLTLALPATSGAAGLVPCNGNDCDFCDLLTLGKNLINWFVEISFVFAVLFFAWGAIVIMTAGGSPGQFSKGTTIIYTVLTGIGILLLAWVFIGTLLQVLTGSPSKLPWSEIQCSVK
ncbi:MAG TPA: hypothetical protein VJH70_02905 [Candidatus Paceibacterota bacterium]